MQSFSLTDLHFVAQTGAGVCTARGWKSATSVVVSRTTTRASHDRRRLKGAEPKRDWTRWPVTSIDSNELSFKRYALSLSGLQTLTTFIFSATGFCMYRLCDNDQYTCTELINRSYVGHNIFHLFLTLLNITLKKRGVLTFFFLSATIFLITNYSFTLKNYM